MSTEAIAPVERLAEVFGAGVLGAASAAAGYGVDEDTKKALDADLDRARVKQVRGKDYLAEHDVVRTANRIFGYGRWGTQVVWQEHLGTVPMTNSKGEEGWYTGYRCCVRLTVAGCVPVDGVGYGDAFEKQWSGQITTHELAVKEAESDAIKRAFKKFGDQFGLILYAKAEDLRRIEAEKHAEERAELQAAASDEGVEELRQMASRVGPDVREKTDAAIKQHRDKNETERGLGPIVTREFLAKMATAIAKQGDEKAKAAGEAARAEAEQEAGTTSSGLKVPEGVVTDGTQAADAEAANVAEGFNA